MTGLEKNLKVRKRSKLWWENYHIVKLAKELRKTLLALLYYKVLSLILFTSVCSMNLSNLLKKLFQMALNSC